MLEDSEMLDVKKVKYVMDRGFYSADNLRFITDHGTIRALDLYTLSNTGAYGEHGPTTVGLSRHKSIPLYSGSLEAHRFAYDVVYTNHQALTEVTVQRRVFSLLNPR